MAKDKIVIYVEGGRVRGVFTKDKNVDVVILDEDDAEDDEMEIDLDKEIKGLKQVF